MGFKNIKKAGLKSSKGNHPRLKKVSKQKKNRFLMEAVPSVATNSHLAGGVYRARTYDLHDVNVAL